MILYQNRMCNKGFNHKCAFLSELLLSNSKNILLFNIDRVVNPDGVRILFKNLFCYDAAMTDRKSKQSHIFYPLTY